MGKVAFGVDIGGTTVKMGLFEKDGCVLDKWEIPTNKEKEGSFILPDVAKSIAAKMQERGLREEDIQGIGVGAPGAVDDEGTLTGGAVNIGWKVFNIPDVLKAYINVPVKALNDANAAAFGEMWQGGGGQHFNHARHRRRRRNYCQWKYSYRSFRSRRRDWAHSH